MGPSFMEAGRIRELRDELAELKKQLEFHERLLQMHSSHIADLRAEARDRAKPRAEEFTARDAYSKAIEIVTTIKHDPFKPLDDRTREWINATLDDVLRALEVRLDRCGGKP